MLVQFKGKNCSDCPFYSPDEEYRSFCTLHELGFIDVSLITSSGFPENCPFKNGEQVEVVALDR